MSNPKKQFSKVHPDCLAFVIAVQSLLNRRKKRDPKNPNWRQAELQGKFSTYRDMRKGRIKNPPHKDTVHAMAKYFECTIEERNDLLVAAGHPLIPLLIQGETLAQATAIAKEIIDYHFPFPCYVINRDWNILLWNDHLLTLFGLSKEDAENILPEHRNILYFIFNPHSPIYRSLSHSREIWEKTAHRNIYGFKLENLFCEREVWYQNIVNVLHNLDEHGFDEFWKAVDPHTAIVPNQLPWQNPEFPFYVTDILVPGHATPIRIRSILTSLGNSTYPQIIGYLPTDRDSRQAFDNLGLPHTYKE